MQAGAHAVDVVHVKLALLAILADAEQNSEVAVDAEGAGIDTAPLLNTCERRKGKKQ